jgi:hypothetical protein
VLKGVLRIVLNSVQKVVLEIVQLQHALRLAPSV